MGLTASGKKEKKKTNFFPEAALVLFPPSEHPIVITHTLEHGKPSFLSEALFSLLIFTIITVGFPNYVS